MKKKIFLSVVIIFALMSLVGVLKVELVRAALLPVGNWMWGGSEDPTISGKIMGTVDGNESGVGWIDLQGVDVPSGDGPVKGYGSIYKYDSYLDFNPQDHCINTGTPTATQYVANCALPSGQSGTIGVFRASNKLTGWGRIVGIAKEHKNGNSGNSDEDGWVKFDASIDASGKITGDAWAGKTLGNLNFSNVTAPQIGVSINVSPFVILGRNETYANNKKDASISWIITGTPTSCTRICKNASGVVTSCPGWSDNNTVTSGSSTVSIFDQKVEFTLTCDGKSDVENVFYGCQNTKCSAADVCSNDTSTAPKQAISGNECTGCGSAADCRSIEIDGWKEVDPFY